MASVPIDATTNTQLDQLALHPPHAVIVYGEPGVGVDAVARQLASNWSKHLETVEPVDGSSIRIEQIRSLYETTRAKYTEARVIHFSSAEKMTHQAQNAFLKLLEEPNEHIRFILSTTRKDILLPTILSRAQQLYVRPLDAAASNAFVDSCGVDSTRKKQILFIAQGLPEEMKVLAENDEYFEKQVALMHDARDILKGTAYQRIVAVHKYSSDRDAAQSILEAVARILRRMIVGGDDRLYQRLEKLLRAQERLEQNANPRLCLLSFVV